MIEQSLEPWLDRKGLARHFACSVRSIEFALADGMPYAVVMGRKKFKASQAEAWLERTGRLTRYGDTPDGELSRNPAGASPGGIIDRVTQSPDGRSTR